MAAPEEEEFNHDLLIANTNGKLLHVPREVWDKAEYEVDVADFEKHEGWKLVRELLECGVTLAAVPPHQKLPEGTIKPLGTCYLVNIEGLKQSHLFHRDRRKRDD